MDQSLRENLRVAYNKRVASRDGRVIEDWKVEDRSHFLDLLHLEGKKSLLEIGAGTGQDSAFFTEQGFQATCIDLSPENVASCQAKGLDAQVMDMCDLQFEPATFDAAFVLNCLLHLPKSEFPTALRQINNVLKDGGVFYLGQYGGYESEGVWEEDNNNPPRFFSFFTDDAIQEFAEQVFLVEGFKAIKLSDQPDDLHFQSLTLRKCTAA